MPTETPSEAESIIQYHEVHARLYAGESRAFHERAAKFCRAQAELTIERDHLRELVKRLSDQIDELRLRADDWRGGDV